MNTNANFPQLRIGEQFYTEIIKPHLTLGFEPKYCIVFVLPLPFQLPFKDLSYFRTTYTNLATVFVFEKFGFTSRKPVLLDHSTEYHEARTRVEMAAFFPEMPLIGSISDISSLTEDAYAFLYRHCLHLLEQLNNFTYAYRMLFEDARVYAISPEQFLYAYVQVCSMPEWSSNARGPMVLSGNPFNYEQILFNVPDQYATAIESLGKYLEQNSNAYSSSLQFFADARRYLYQGHPREAVVFLGMSSEALLNGLFRHIRVADGKSDAEIDAELEDIPFMSRIKKHISRGLGGDWDFTREGSPGWRWKKHVYELRNRVVHGGYFPKQREANEAFATLVNFSHFLRNRVEKRRKHLPSVKKELDFLPPFAIGGTELETFDVS